MLIAAAAMLVGHTAHGLTAHDFSTEEAERGVCEFLAGSWALPADSFVCEGVVVLGQADEFEDGGMG